MAKYSVELLLKANITNKKDQHLLHSKIH